MELDNANNVLPFGHDHREHAKSLDEQVDSFIDELYSEAKLLKVISFLITVCGTNDPIWITYRFLLLFGLYKLKHSKNRIFTTCG